MFLKHLSSIFPPVSLLRNMACWHSKIIRTCFPERPSGAVSYRLKFSALDLCTYCSGTPSVCNSIGYSFSIFPFHGSPSGNRAAAARKSCRCRLARVIPATGWNLAVIELMLVSSRVSRRFMASPIEFVPPFSLRALLVSLCFVSKRLLLLGCCDLRSSVRILYRFRANLGLLDLSRFLLLDLRRGE